LLKEAAKIGEFQEKITHHYGYNYMRHSKVYGCVERFRKGEDLLLIVSVLGSRRL
jgi:hypothetical protein